jgi:hypothetical protein
VKHLLASIPVVLLVACTGTGQPKSAAPAPKPMPPVEPVVKKPPPEPEPPPPPPPPMEWHATARLDPVKGVKMPPFEITFFQVEGESTRARTDGTIAKLKAGKYQLAVHQGDTCGPKAKLAGPVMVVLTQDGPLVATRKETPSVDVTSIAIPLDGDGSIVGKTLVLHADKRGKLGNPVACGAIVAASGE